MSGHFLTKLLLRNCSFNAPPTTAAIIVVGDEILNGAVLDTNSHFIAKELHGLGIEVRRISVIPDNLQAISKEVKEFSSLYDYVITSGGIGPTHDDLTYEAVAHAFNEPLVLNPQLKEICQGFYQTKDDNAPGMKLAKIPQSAKLTQNPHLNFPNVSIRNVYMFPGIPELLTKIMSQMSKTLFVSKKTFFKETIYFNRGENEIVNSLNKIVKEFPNVQCGSYPKFCHNEYKVMVTLESYDEAATKAALEKLRLLVPQDFIVELKEPC